jgi:hypothetical protein
MDSNFRFRASGDTLSDRGVKPRLTGRSGVSAARITAIFCKGDVEADGVCPRAREFQAKKIGDLAQ